MKLCKEARQRIKYIKHKLAPRKTYSQHQEDLVLQQLFGSINRFIDIGANDGITCSNTFLFALKGAKGLCFEPVPRVFHRLKLLYSFNPNIICIQEGISEEAKTLTIRDEDLVSYITETQDEKLVDLLSDYYSTNCKTETISVKPLTYWLERYPKFSQCDFVNLDVEGHEWYVLKGIDFSRFQTKCFVIETHTQRQGKQWVHKDYEQIDHLLNTWGYKALLKNELNTFWFAEQSVKPSQISHIPHRFANYEVL